MAQGFTKGIPLDVDGTLSANSDNLAPSQKAVKTYVDARATGTNTGDQTSIVGISGTKSQFDTACTDGDFLFVGDVIGLTDGDKGDITVSSSGTVWEIDAATIGTTELSATGTADNTTFLRGDNTWATPTAADPAGWTTIVKSANQDVTNNATLQDDTELQFSVVAGGHYMLDMDLVISANDSTGDYKFAFTVTSGTIDGWGTMQSLTTASAITNVLVSASSSASTSSLSIGAAADIDRLLYTRLNFAFYASANATFKFQFANNTAAAGRTSRTWKGSILKYKRID